MTKFEVSLDFMEEIMARPLSSDWRNKSIFLPLTDSEIDANMIRVEGDCICDECGLEYYKHPHISNITYENYPFLNYICNGVIAKL